MTSNFQNERQQRIAANAQNANLKNAASQFALESIAAQYSYNFEWLGRPIIQYPQDMVAMQELIWKVRPDLIIETGIAHGGSLILSASMLAMLDLCDAIQAGTQMDPRQSKRRVLGVDIEIRPHNLAAIETHPMSSRIQMIQGSSIAAEVIEQVRQVASGYERIMVCLDSNHTHEHVFAELEAYAPLTSVGSYCVVFDTIIEDMPEEMFSDRPWGPRNNPRTAVTEFLKTNQQFESDVSIDAKLLVSVAPCGYLRRNKKY